MPRKDDRRLRIGVLGCGPIAQFAHFEACTKARNADLYAICDVAEDLRTRMAATHAPEKTFADYDAMLADPAVEEVEALRDAVTRSGLTLQIGHMKRFDPGLEAAKIFIDTEMGDILALKAWYCDSTHRYTMTDAVQPLPVTSKNARKPTRNPKADLRRYYMLAHGSHLVDTARWLCGPVTEVHARLSERFGAYCWFVETSFANGTLGHLDLTVSVRMDWHEGLQLYGQNGSVIAKTFNPWYYRSSEVEIFYEADATTRRPLGADGHFYRRQIEGFADTILHGAPMRGADAEDGVASIRAMVAIARSVETGRPVRLDEVSGAL
jgi:predicted dehydrogenase